MNRRMNCHHLLLLPLLCLIGCGGKKQCSRVKALTHTTRTKKDTANKLSTAGLSIIGRRLFEAACHDNAGIIKALVAEDVVDLNVCNRAGETALHQAAICGNANAVAILLETGANPNIARRSNGKTALHYAVEYSHADDTCIVQLLLSAGANPNGTQAGEMTPLHIAVAREHIPAARLLLAHGADPNRTSTQAAPNLNRELHAHYYFTSILEHTNTKPKKMDLASLTPLHLATLLKPSENATTLVATLVEANAKTDTSIGKPFNLTPIHLAACMGNTSCIKILCAPATNVNVSATAGVTPLHIAAAYGHTATTQAILANGADVNAADCIKQTTPLMLAAESMQALIHAGAKQPYEIPRKHDDKSTHLAQMEQTVQALLEWPQTNLFARNSRNHTAYDVAKETVERIDEEIQAQQYSRMANPNSLGGLLATISEDKLRSNRRRARHTLDIIKMAMRQRSATAVA